MQRNSIVPPDCNCGWSCKRREFATHGSIARRDGSEQLLRHENCKSIIDVEGGQATLFVTPEKHSLLIDTGFAGNNGRDSDRIVAAAREKRLEKIDYVLITHFHGDHVGGARNWPRKFRWDIYRSR